MESGLRALTPVRGTPALDWIDTRDISLFKCCTTLFCAVYPTWFHSLGSLKFYQPERYLICCGTGATDEAQRDRAGTGAGMPMG